MQTFLASITLFTLQHGYLTSYVVFYPIFLSCTYVYLHLLYVCVYTYVYLYGYNTCMDDKISRLTCKHTYMPAISAIIHMPCFEHKQTLNDFVMWNCVHPWFGHQLKITCFPSWWNHEVHAWSPCSNRPWSQPSAQCNNHTRA